MLSGRRRHIRRCDAVGWVVFGIWVRGAFALLRTLRDFNRGRGSLGSVVLVGHKYLTAAFYLGRAGHGHYAPI